MEISAMLKSFLMTENYEVIAVSDGESACERFFSDDFVLVLLDLMIPKRNGMEVMGKIRESSTVPIIIISAKDTISHCESSGFVEGNNNKFKLIKRIVYGRSGLVNLTKKCKLAFLCKNQDFNLLDLV